MNKQKQRQRKRQVKQMKKRRVNLFMLDKRVKQLDSELEMSRLASEQTEDLLAALEAKVADLLAQHSAEKREMFKRNKRSFVAKLWQMLGQKGEP